MKSVERIRDLKGLGPKSEAQLKRVGIESVKDFMGTDPFEIYRALKASGESTSLNLLYAMLGAQDGCHWKEVADSRRSEILMRLDDLGLAP